MSNLWEMILKGGVVMIPLFFTSILALAVVIERGFFLRRRRIIKPEILDMIQRIEKPEDAEKATFGLSQQKGPFSNVIRVGLQNHGRSREEIKEAVVDQGRQETRVLERGLGVLETVAGISPLLGLLGTVLGMVRVFRVISEQGLGQTQSLSGGISQALITTVVGLSIAIPALVAYNYFSHKVEDLVMEIEKHSAALLEKLNRF